MTGGELDDTGAVLDTGGREDVELGETLASLEGGSDETTGVDETAGALDTSLTLVTLYLSHQAWG